VDDNKQEHSVDRFAQQWNYRPGVPINTSPVFQWPPNPVKIAKWFAARWFVFGENLILVALSSLTWFYFHPSLEQTATLKLDWILMIFVRNIILISIVAGGLHFFLHSRKSQGNRLKFDPRDVTAKGRLFTLGTQLYDNIFWTLTSGVFFWTVFPFLLDSPLPSLATNV